MIGKTVSQWLKAWWLLLVPIAFASGAVLAYALTFRQLPANEDPGAWGTFGDFLGGLLNPLVSTLTLFVAASVWKLQREELELTRKELEQTKLAMEEQAKTAEQQRQEQRFFDLLNVYQQTVASISFEKHKPSGEFPVQYTGKEAISKYLNSPEGLLDIQFFKNRQGQGCHAMRPYPPLQHSDLIRQWHNETVTSLFSHYFRVIFRILTEAEALLGNQHIRYIKLFRAQLSRAELIILGFHLWLDEEGKYMLPLVVKYGLLKHLPNGDLRTELEQELPALAFGPSWAAEHTRQTSSTAAKEATA